MLWLHVALTCNSHLFGRVGRSAHDTRIFLEAIDNPRIKFSKPPEGSNMCMCVCVYMIINVILFFLQFSILKNYMHLQGNTTWLFQDILLNMDF